MFNWPGGGFTLDEDILPHKKTVTLTWEQLLFEGARRADTGTLVNPKHQTGTITTVEPLTIRMPDNQAKLTIIRPDLQPTLYQLEQEYTHVGRAAGNEICLPYPSVSNRHCIFIQSGPDIVLRDLNSSNGTCVNGESISEVVLRPGDQIQIGSVQMKFEPGIKRPKLLTPEGAPTPSHGQAASTGAPVFQTVRLAGAPARSAPPRARVKDDSAFVKGESAISYESIAPPEPVESPKKKTLNLVISAIVCVALIAGGAYYYFVILQHGH